MKQFSVEEVKAQINSCEGKGALFYPQLIFVVKIGDKTHIGSVHLLIDKFGRLNLWAAHVYCGSKKWGGRSPSVANLTGTAVVTCERCNKGARKEINLDSRNGAYLRVIPLIGKKIG
jgi:hypothetical protein